MFTYPKREKKKRIKNLCSTAFRKRGERRLTQFSISNNAASVCELQLWRIEEYRHGIRVVKAMVIAGTLTANSTTTFKVIILVDINAVTAFLFDKY